MMSCRVFRSLSDQDARHRCGAGSLSQYSFNSTYTHNVWLARLGRWDLVDTA